MNVSYYYVTFGPPNFTPIVLVTPFYFKTEAQGRAAFHSLLDIGPYNDIIAELPCNQWNTAASIFCIKGGRKLIYGAGFTNILETPWYGVQRHLHRMQFIIICAIHLKSDIEFYQSQCPFQRGVHYLL